MASINRIFQLSSNGLNSRKNIPINLVLTLEEYFEAFPRQLSGPHRHHVETTKTCKVCSKFKKF
jgi:hypothetical protein